MGGGGPPAAMGRGGPSLRGDGPPRGMAPRGGMGGVGGPPAKRGRWDGPSASSSYADSYYNNGSQDFGNAAGGFDDGGYGSAAPTSRSSYQDPYSAPPDMMGNGYQAPSTGGYGEPAGGYSSEFSKPMDRGVGDYRSSSVGGYAAPPIAGGGYASSYDDNRGYGGGRQDGGYGSSVPPADGFGARPAVDAYGGGGPPRSDDRYASYDSYGGASYNQSRDSYGGAGRY